MSDGQGPGSRASGAGAAGGRGSYRLMPAPADVILFRRAAEPGSTGPVVRLAGEITAPGAICDIVGLIAQAGWAGELAVLTGEESRSLFFDSGSILGAQTNLPGERIGALLQRLGILDAIGVQAVSSSLGGGKKFGEVAVQLGFLSRERLFEVIAKQTKEIAFAMLLVPEGMFYFLDRYDPGRVAAPHRLSATNVLMESLQRMDETQYFRERIPSDAHVPVPVAGRADPQPELVTVWRACDGHRSVLDIMRACAMTEFEVMRALFQLVQSGFLRITSPRPSGPMALVAIFNEAMATIYRAAEQAGLSAALREHLAEFASGFGIYDLLFAGAGPAEDGRFDAARIDANLRALGGGDSDDVLAQRLYPYVAFALFDTGSQLPKEDERLLSDQVAEMIRALAPTPEAG